VAENVIHKYDVKGRSPIIFVVKSFKHSLKGRSSDIFPPPRHCLDLLISGEGL